MNTTKNKIKKIRKRLYNVLESGSSLPTSELFDQPTWKDVLVLIDELDTINRRLENIHKIAALWSTDKNTVVHLGGNTEKTTTEVTFQSSPDYDKKHVEPPDCVCNHDWEHHHHGCIMNPKFPSEYHAIGICRGVLAQECEATQVNGQRLVKYEKDVCDCNGYRGKQKVAKSVK